MILSFLVSCASKKSGNTDIKQDTAQGTAQNSDAMDDDIPRNPYGDTDFSRPQGFDEKRDGVDYGYMNDRVIYYSSTIGKDKMCGVLLPAGYDEKELEDALEQNITRFLLELGSGFAFIGRQKEIIYLRFVHEMSFEEISEIMEINIQSARNLLTRSMEKLRKEVSSTTILFFIYMISI